MALKLYNVKNTKMNNPDNYTTTVDTVQDSVYKANEKRQKEIDNMNKEFDKQYNDLKKMHLSESLFDDVDNYIVLNSGEPCTDLNNCEVTLSAGQIIEILSQVPPETNVFVKVNTLNGKKYANLTDVDGGEDTLEENILGMDSNDVKNYAQAAAAILPFVL